MEKQRLNDSLLHRGLQRWQRVGVCDSELGDGGAPQAGQMSAAAELLTHFVGDRPYVGTRGHAGAESGLIGCSVQNLEFFNFYLYRLVGGPAFFSGRVVG